MQQYFRVIRGQSAALDDETNSSAVPVFASVSPEMSDSGPSADSADGRSTAASLTFARQMASVTENLVAAQGVLPGTAACQSSLATDVVAMNATLSQLISVISNLATQQGNLATQVGTLATTVTVTENTVSTAAATSRNCLDAIQALPGMGQALATVVGLKQRNADALAHSNRPRLGVHDGSNRNEANWEASSRSIWECWKPGCTALLTDASLTFRLDANRNIELDVNGLPTVVLTPENRRTAETISQSVQAVMKDSARVTVQAALDEYSAVFADAADGNRSTGMIFVV